MIRRALRAAALILLLSAGAALAAADAFVPGVNDLPLMPGLRAQTDDAVVFDAPGGRIVEAWTEGAVTRAAVHDFYRRTLPQLGWTETAEDHFHREGEALILEFPAADPQGERPGNGQILVRFYLSPG